MQNTNEISKKDYEFALIIGLLIGIFLFPLERNLGLTSKYPFIYQASFFAAPLCALAGIFFAHLLFARFRLIWQFAKFGLVGVSNTIINFGVYNTLLYFSHASNTTPKIVVALFAAISFLAALINSYIWNSHWAFKSSTPRTVREFEKFFLITLIGLLINSAVVYLVTRAAPASIQFKYWANLANLVGTLVTLFWNFSGYRLIVFKDALSSGKAAAHSAK